MNPLICVNVSAFERLALLVEKGTPLPKALRQVAQELQEHEAAHQGQNIPMRPYTDRLGVIYKRAS